MYCLKLLALAPAGLLLVATGVALLLILGLCYVLIILIFDELDQ